MVVKDGDSFRRVIQRQGRIDIKDSFLRELGWSEGDDVVVKLRGETLKVEYRGK